MIKLELTVEETNYILNVLACQPYKEVVELIDKIRTTATNQLTHEISEEEYIKMGGVSDGDTTESDEG